MKRYGLTGGIGMGKSAVADWLAAHRVAVVDTDVLARELVQPGQTALQEIEETFGRRFVGTDGQLQRSALAEVVFGDATARKRLEAILHPRIREAWRAQVAAFQREGRPMVVVVIPLLFEVHAEPEFDRTVCVACSETVQFQRLVARGWDANEIHRRITAQLPIRTKMEKADFVIWNDFSRALVDEQLARLFQLAA